MEGPGLNVSRETLEKLRAFVNLVEKWTVKINLISKQSMDDIWNRHVVDSAQIYDLAPKAGKWVDLGSGGGFPGIVAAILSDGENADLQFVLIESDKRKAVFLRTAVRELGLRADVLSERIEEVDGIEADILTARALAELDLLLNFTSIHMRKDGTALFPKGAQWQKEHEIAQLRWSYSCDPITSKTNPSAAILMIKDIARV